MCDYWQSGKTTTHESCGGMPTRNVLVEDSLLLQGHGASIGSETSGSVANVVFRRIQFHHTECGVRLKTARGRGSFIRNVTYEDCTMSDVANGVTMESFYPSDTPAVPINASISTPGSRAVVKSSSPLGE